MNPFDPFGGKSLVFLHFVLRRSSSTSYWIAIDPRKRFVLLRGTKVSGAANRLFRLPRQRFLFVKGLFSTNLQTCAGIRPVVGSVYEPLSQKEAAGFGEFAQMTTAVSNQSPVLTLRAAPISRLWMLRPGNFDQDLGETNETKKNCHPCIGRNDPMQRPLEDILLMSSSCRSNAQLLADSVRPSNIQS